MELTLTDLVLSRADDQMIKLSDSLLADTIKGKHTPDLIARGTAQKMTNLVGQNARNIAEDLTSDDVMADDAEDLIVSALHRYAESKLVRIAEEAVLQAYRAGRADELDDFSDEMAAQGREVQWFRSSVLSPSTCGPCEDADGSPIDSADEDLSDICEGGENCRCMPFADLAEEI
jgi:histone H3/H4